MNFFSKILISATLLLLSGQISAQTPQFVVSMTPHEAVTGDTVCLPVFAVNFTDIAGGQYAHNWNPDELELVSVEIAQIDSSFSVSYNPTLPGRLLFLFQDISIINGFANSIADSTTLYSLCFKVKDTTGCALVQTNGVGMPNSAPAAVETDMGVNVFNPAVNPPGEICIEVPSSTSNPGFEAPIMAFPNPFADQFTLQNVPVGGQICIIDAHGKMMTRLETVASTITIPAALWPTGMYFWQIRLPNGQITTQGKVVRN